MSYEEWKIEYEKNPNYIEDLEKINNYFINELIGCNDYLQIDVDLINENDAQSFLEDELYAIKYHLDSIKVDSIKKPDDFVVAKLSFFSDKSQELFNDCIYKNDFFCDYIEVNHPFSLDTYDTISFNEYVDIVKKLKDLIKPSVYDLSDFEKIIYAYNVSKKFKIYNMDPNEKPPFKKGRFIKDIIYDEYYLCYGFVNMFLELLKQLNVKGYYLENHLDVSYEDYEKGLEDLCIEKCIQKTGHCRALVCIKDDKYNIDGMYYFDPTNDQNNLKGDCYNFFALTSDQMDDCVYPEYQSYDFYGLLRSKTKDEFFSIINKIDDKSEFTHSIRIILGVIYDYDYDFFNYIYNKYKEYKGESYPVELLEELAEFVCSHNNREINFDTLYEAVKNVYLETTNYTNNNVDEKLQEVFKDNSKRQNGFFYYREKIGNNMIEKYSGHNRFAAIDSQKTI